MDDECEYRVNSYGGCARMAAVLVGFVLLAALVVFVGAPLVRARTEQARAERVQAQTAQQHQQARDELLADEQRLAAWESRFEHWTTALAAFLYAPHPVPVVIAPAGGDRALDIVYGTLQCVIGGCIGAILVGRWWAKRKEDR